MHYKETDRRISPKRRIDTDTEQFKDLRYSDHFQEIFLNRRNLALLLQHPSLDPKRTNSLIFNNKRNKEYF